MTEKNSAKQCTCVQQFKSTWDSPPKPLKLSSTSLLKGGMCHELSELRTEWLNGHQISSIYPGYTQAQRC